MTKQIIFEVHVFQKGRWEIHARHAPSEMDAAVEEAKGLDLLASIDMVKVILEEYDDVSGRTRETTIYRTPGRDEHTGQPLSKDTAAINSRNAAKSAGSSFFDDDDDDYDEDDGDFLYQANRSSRAKKKGKGKGKGKGKETSFVGVLVKILLIMLFSVTIAALMAGGTVMFLRDTTLTTNMQTNIVFVIFIIIFLVSALVLSLNFMSSDKIAGKKGRVQRSRPRPAKVEKQAPKPEKKPKEEKREKRGIEKDEDLDPSKEGLDSTAGDNEETPQKKEPEPEPEPEKPTEEKEPKKEETTGLSPHAEKQRVYLMTFLSEGLEKSGADTRRLDSFNKFGLNLFLAGACEIMGQTKNLNHYSLTKILAGTVSLMGFKDSDAANFAEKYEDYLLADARYMQMFQAGRNAMNTFMEQDPESVKYLGQALTEWNKPTQKEESAGPVTVLFTDIAGSTAMTQDLGDAIAQQVVRAHNRIVREALTDFNGKEIKHTGDGIMASFSTTSNGIDAAIQMQTGTAKHNTNNPDLPLHLKIGINAGEPISEDNDLFGSTVQMAARIVDKAKADQIFVSEIVRGICAGKDIAFDNRGPYEMKGFDEPPILYEVSWTSE
jgi:adenylate cyclase